MEFRRGLKPGEAAPLTENQKRFIELVRTQIDEELPGFEQGKQKSIRISLGSLRCPKGAEMKALRDIYSHWIINVYEPFLASSSYCLDFSPRGT